MNRSLVTFSAICFSVLLLCAVGVIGYFIKYW